MTKKQKKGQLVPHARRAVDKRTTKARARAKKVREQAPDMANLEGASIRFDLRGRVWIRKRKVAEQFARTINSSGEFWLGFPPVRPPRPPDPVDSMCGCNLYARLLGAGLGGDSMPAGAGVDAAPADGELGPGLDV